MVFALQGCLLQVTYVLYAGMCTPMGPPACKRASGGRAAASQVEVLELHAPAAAAGPGPAGATGAWRAGGATVGAMGGGAVVKILLRQQAAAGRGEAACRSDVLAVKRRVEAAVAGQVLRVEDPASLAWLFTAEGKAMLKVRTAARAYLRALVCVRTCTRAEWRRERTAA